MRTKVLLGVLFCVSVIRDTCSLENGLALTPPMGWLSWERFRCITNCDLYPDECISEKLIRDVADRIVQDGYLDAGYEYVIVDDCWLAGKRDENGRLQPDPDRFPSGIKNLSDYVHGKGLKFGIYEDYGTYTCGGFPGVLGHLEEDAQTFGEWAVDYVKLDGCYADPLDMNEGYPEFGRYLLETNRSIVYSCSWPVYQEEQGIFPNFTALKETCNLWRNWDDIQDSWTSVSAIIEYFGNRQEIIAQHAGPGHWNDPDMLIVGNYGLSYEQAKAQMAIWAILAAPLIMSHDPRTVRPEFRDILLNQEVIRVNQDPLGIQGKRVYMLNSVQIWTRPIEPVVDGVHSWAVAVLNKREDGAPYAISVPLVRIGLDGPVDYIFTELFGAVEAFELSSDGTLTARTPPTGVLLFKAQVKRRFKTE